MGPSEHQFHPYVKFVLYKNKAVNPLKRACSFDFFWKHRKKGNQQIIFKNYSNISRTLGEKREKEKQTNRKLAKKKEKEKKKEKNKIIENYIYNY